MEKTSLTALPDVQEYGDEMYTMADGVERRKGEDIDFNFESLAEAQQAMTLAIIQARNAPRVMRRGPDGKVDTVETLVDDPSPLLAALTVPQRVIRNDKREAVGLETVMQ